MSTSDITRTSRDFRFGDKDYWFFGWLLQKQVTKQDKIAAWGDSYYLGLLLLHSKLAHALDPRYAAVAVQCPACGIETPKLYHRDGMEIGETRIVTIQRIGCTSA